MIVAGFGFRSGAGLESLLDAYTRARGAQRAELLVTLPDKAQEPGLLALAQMLQLPLRAIDPAALDTIETLTKSAQSLAAHGTGSVAEASALAAAGPGGRLLAARAISQDRRATCALAIGDSK